MSTSLLSRIARVAAVGTAVVAMSLGFTTSAHAAGMTASLVVSGTDGNGHVYVVTDGLVPMSQANAEFLVKDGATLKLRLWGDDTPTDTLLFGPFFGANGAHGTYWIDQAGLHYRSAIQVPANLLNEDRAIFNPVDEVFVSAAFVTKDGITLNSTNSNVVVRSF